LGLPPERITVNLAPADLPKEGSQYDLPIALGLMVAMGALPAEAVKGFVAIGELSLDGRIGGVPGALPAAMAAMSWGLGLICPTDCGPEAAWSGLASPDNQGIVAADHILQLINHLRETQILPPPEPLIETAQIDMPDMSDVRGQPQARLTLEVAAAGGHNLLFTGSPGAGKSVLAARLPCILPPLQSKQRLEVAMIKSLSSGGSGVNMASHRPFRAPHHSASMSALIGGGRQAKPGEISLSHNGVLFLDELPKSLFRPSMPCANLLKPVR
jgi:magnesium chelatase family protein